MVQWQIHHSDFRLVSLIEYLNIWISSRRSTFYHLSRTIIIFTIRPVTRILAREIHSLWTVYTLKFPAFHFLVWSSIACFELLIYAHCKLQWKENEGFPILFSWDENLKKFSNFERREWRSREEFCSSNREANARLIIFLSRFIELLTWSYESLKLFLNIERSCAHLTRPVTIIFSRFQYVLISSCNDNLNLDRRYPHHLVSLTLFDLSNGQDRYIKLLLRERRIINI